MVDLTSKCKYVCKYKKNSSLDVMNPNFSILHLFYVATLPLSRQTHRTKPIKTSSNRLLSSKFAASWTRFIELAILLSIVIGVIWLISKIVTPQVVTTVSVIVGFLILRFIVRVILKVTFTLLSILFWLAILCAILLCVL